MVIRVMAPDGNSLFIQNVIDMQPIIDIQPTNNKKNPTVEPVRFRMIPRASSIFLFPALLIACIAVIFGCKKTYNYGLDNNVSAVKNLFYPQDSFYVKLQPATGASVAFQWDAAKAEDGSLVLYEIAFDKPGGDFSNPVFKLASDGNGMNNQATLTHKQLNQIASLAGIPSLGTGNLIWTVYSTKGLYEVKAARSRTVTVLRPAGFANPPADLYLTGSATEAGTNIGQAIHFNQTNAGVFELYTSLKAGTYQFIDRISGNPVTFYLNGQNIQQTGSTTYSDTTAVVRFNLDFNNAAASVTVIRSIGFWHGLSNAVAFSLNYKGAGVWGATSQTVATSNPGWGYEPRYKFRYTVNAGGGAADSYEWYGSGNGDNPVPTSSTPASYWYLKPVTSDQWNNCYKFAAYASSSVVDVTLTMAPGSPYTHTLILH